MSVKQNKNTVAVHRDILTDLAREANLKEKDMKVGLVLLSMIDSNDYKSVDIKSISGILGIKDSEVEDALLNLEIADFIQRGGNIYTSDGYKFL